MDGVSFLFIPKDYNAVFYRCDRDGCDDSKGDECEEGQAED